MTFIKGDKINLSAKYDNEEMAELLNTDFKGSQLHRLPLFIPKENDNNNLILAIMFNAGGNQKLIGRVSLEDINHINQSAELKIFVSPEHQGKGIGLEACKLIIRHAFLRLNLRRVYAGTLDNNEGFKKLAEGLRMEQEGIRKEAVHNDGKFIDVIEFGLLKGGVLDNGKKEDDDERERHDDG